MSPFTEQGHAELVPVLRELTDGVWSRVEDIIEHSASLRRWLVRSPRPSWTPKGVDDLAHGEVDVGLVEPSELRRRTSCSSTCVDRPGCCPIPQPA